MSDRSQTILRYALGVLLAFAALNAFGGGYYAMSGAEGVPTQWLEGSPFHNYYIPGLILFVVVGGAFLTAAISVFAGLRIAKAATLCAVGILFIWLAVQMRIIGYVSWMQPATGIVALVILLMSWRIPDSEQKPTLKEPRPS